MVSGPSKDDGRIEYTYHLMARAAGIGDPALATSPPTHAHRRHCVPNLTLLVSIGAPRPPPTDAARHKA
ncbi:MAG: hypothetical protein AMXMBFR78_19450 [Rubrivivax sp.]